MFLSEQIYDHNPKIKQGFLRIELDMLATVYAIILHL
jgi:hypothetical protein